MSDLDHAVVIGGSFAGMVSARVLSDHFDRVTIVERDDLPDGPNLRKGVPQGPHVHGILQLGREILDDLFPGFVDETKREGALLFDWMEWSGMGRKSKALGYGVRRPLLEYVVRRRVAALPNVEIVRGRGEGLVAGTDRRVIGAVVAELNGGATSTVEADLVVEASGRGSAAPSWLEHAGFTAPSETVVNAFGGYASRLLRVPEDAWPGEMRFAAQLPMPGFTKGAIVYPQDSGYYVVSLFGQSRDYPPSDEEGFDAFLQGCAVPTMHTVVSRSEAVTEIRTSRSTANRWRHYENLVDPPAGFVAVGDAASTFNPMNGQGISTACLGAVTLGETLVHVDGDLRRLPLAFQSRLAERMVFPWRTAVNFDFQFPETVGERPAPTAAAVGAAEYLGALQQIARTDPDVQEAFLLATQTFDPDLLTTAAFVAKVEAWAAEDGDQVAVN